MEFASVGGVLAAVLVQVLVTAAFVAWGRWVARRQGGGWWNRLAWAPAIAYALRMTGIGLTVVALVASFRDVADVAPDRKAAVLSDAISTAMWPTAVLG